MSAIDRADEDVRRGDLGLARMRLVSYLNAKGYDAALLDRLGRLSWEMHDLCQAGRYWLASGSEGANVEKAIRAFLSHTGPDPRVIAKTLPRAVMHARLETLPDMVQERFRNLALTQAVRKECQRRRIQERTWRGKVLDRAILCFVACFVMLVIVGWVNGIWTIASWLSD